MPRRSSLRSLVLLAGVLATSAGLASVPASGVALAAPAVASAGSASASAPARPAIVATVLSAPATLAPPAAPPAPDEIPADAERTVLSLPSNAPTGEPAAILNWGRVELHQMVTGVIELVNTTSEPMKILAMRPSCRCTALSDLSGEVIEAGGSREVALTVETGDTTGERVNEVRFAFDRHRPLAVRLVFEAARAVEAGPAFVSATDTAHPYGVFELVASDGRPFRVLSSGGADPIFAMHHDPDRDPARTDYKLAWDLSAYDPQTCLDADGRRMPMFWLVETDHPGAPLVELRVRHMPCTRPDVPDQRPRRWFARPFHAIIPEAKRGSAVDLPITLVWLRDAVVDDTLESVEVQSDVMRPEVVSAKQVNDEVHAVVRLHIAADAPLGAWYEDLTLQGGHPQSSQRFSVGLRIVD